MTMADAFEAQLDPTANHVALKVRDLKTALDFYHGIIGLPISRTSGPPDNPQMVWLPGVQLIRHDGDLEPGGTFDHVALGVANIEEVCSRLDRAGFQAETPLQRRSREDVGRELMMAFYRDPDGNRVELLKYL